MHALLPLIWYKVTQAGKAGLITWSRLINIITDIVSDNQSVWSEKRSSLPLNQIIEDGLVLISPPIPCVGLLQQKLRL